MYSNSKKKCAFFKTLCKNTVETCRPQVTIWRMRIVGWLLKVTNKDSEYVILIAFPRQQ